jgi:hypothetical protein
MLQQKWQLVDELVSWAVLGFEERTPIHAKAGFVSDCEQLELHWQVAGRQRLRTLATRFAGEEQLGAQRKSGKLAFRSFLEPRPLVLVPLLEPERWLRQRCWLPAPCAVHVWWRTFSSSLVIDGWMRKTRC